MIDTFKTYEGYENRYIVEYYIRDVYFDSVIADFDSYTEAEDYRDDNDDYMTFYVNEKAQAEIVEI